MQDDTHDAELTPAPTAPAADDYSATAQGIRQAAADLDGKREREGPTLVPDEDDVEPESDIVTIRRIIPTDEPQTLKAASRDLAEFRRQQREQEKQALAELTDEQPERAVEAEQQPRAETQPQPDQAQQRATPEQAQQLYEVGLATVLHQIKGVAASEFKDIRSAEHLAQLQTTDPARWLRFQELELAWQGTAQNAMQALAYRQHEAEHSFKQFAEKNDQLAAEKIPEARGPERAAFEDQAINMLKSHGFERAELSAAWAGRDTFSLRDARVQSVVADATRWRNARARAHAAVAKSPPPYQRPGVAGAISSNGTDLERLSSRLSKTGSLQDAMKLRLAQTKRG